MWAIAHAGAKESDTTKQLNKNKGLNRLLSSKKKNKKIKGETASLYEKMIYVYDLKFFHSDKHPSKLMVIYF